MTHNPLPEELNSNEKLADRWKRFGEILEELDSGLTAIAGKTFEIWGSGGGNWIGEVSSKDFVHKIRNISWSLTSGTYANGGVGQVASSWGDKDRKTWLSAKQEINADSFLVYASHPHDQGLYYLAAHETGHVSDLGLATGEKCAKEYRERTADDKFTHYPASAEWAYNEAVANIIAKRVCGSLGYPVLPNPVAGYSISMMPKWLHGYWHAKRTTGCCGGWSDDHIY